MKPSPCVTFVVLCVMSMLAAKASLADTTQPPASTQSPTPNSPTTSSTPAVTTTTPAPTNVTTQTTQTTGSMTSTAGNSTETPPSTTPAQTTTPAPTTTPATTTTPSSVGEWTVFNNSDNKICMKMSFSGTLNMNDKNATSSSLPIPPQAESSSSKCAGSRSDFVLTFYSDVMQKTYSVQLQFILQEDSKRMYMWNASVTALTNTTVVDSASSQLQIRFDTPVGMSYQCNEQTIPVGTAYNLTLSQITLQPFASKAGHDYGKAYSCKPKSGPSSATIVGLVLGAIIFALVIAIIYQCRSKKSSNTGPRYNQFS